MFLGRIGHALGGKLLKSADDAETGVAGLDDIVDVTVAGCIVGVAEQLVVFRFLLGKHLLGIVRSLGLLGIEHLDCTCTTHNCDFSCGPCVVHIATQLLAAHHDVAAAVALAECDGNLGHSGLSVGIEKFCAVQNHTVVLLTCTGKESGHVDQRYDGDVESIAETHETGSLARSVAVEHTGEELGLVGHDTYALAVETGETDDDVLGIVALDFKGIRRYRRWRR